MKPMNLMKKILWTYEKNSYEQLRYSGPYETDEFDEESG